MKRAVLLSLICCAALSAAGIKQPKYFARRDYPSGGGLVIVGDVTGNGRLDIVAIATTQRVSTLLGNGNGTFKAAKVWDIQWGFMYGGALADLNGDGKQDLVIGGGVSSSNSIGVCFSNGDGTFQAPVIYTAGGAGVGNPVVADFNGDGILDVIVPSNAGLVLFAGKGGGVFNPGVLVSAFSGAFWITAADFNGDGKLDLAVSYYPTGQPLSEVQFGPPFDHGAGSLARHTKLCMLLKVPNLSSFGAVPWNASWNLPPGVTGSC